MAERGGGHPKTLAFRIQPILGRRVFDLLCRSTCPPSAVTTPLSRVSLISRLIILSFHVVRCLFPRLNHLVPFAPFCGHSHPWLRNSGQFVKFVSFLFHPFFTSRKASQGRWIQHKIVFSKRPTRAIFTLLPSKNLSKPLYL